MNDLFFLNMGLWISEKTWLGPKFFGNSLPPCLQFTIDIGLPWCIILILILVPNLGFFPCPVPTYYKLVMTPVFVKTSTRSGQKIIFRTPIAIAVLHA